jgi:hypothetical protein
MIRPIGYEVLLTPLVAKNTYGTTINVTKDVEIAEYIKQRGISSIKREVDNGDFDIGVFVFDSLNITCLNVNGKFSDANDSRSMFKYMRDKAKVKINFYDGKSNTASISFKGIVDDRSSKLDFEKNEIKMKVLSQDSIINRTKVPSGAIIGGMLASTSIRNILNLPEISSVLVYDVANINPLVDCVIDNGEAFDGKSVKAALDMLLVVTNSVMLVDKSDNIIVRGRDYNSGKVHRFYGEGDVFGRQNIVNIRNYNNGLQRAFNTITVNTQSRSNAGFIDTFGDNVKSLSFEFITNPTTEANIAANILDYWKAPKTELEVIAKTSEVKDLNFFDLVSIDYYYRVKPYSGSKLPMYGSAIYGEAVYPYVSGNLKIRPKMAFKVIGLTEDPSTFLTTVKLREIGTKIDDGFFGKIGTYYGYSIYGIDDYEFDSERLDPNRRSVYGAGKYGTVVFGLS